MWYGRFIRKHLDWVFYACMALVALLALAQLVHLHGPWVMRHLATP